MDLGLKGRACVVTGASRGIGAETASLLCAEGDRPAVEADGERPAAHLGAGQEVLDAAQEVHRVAPRVELEQVVAEHAAHHARTGLEGSEFADAFNQPAYAEVSVFERGNEPEKIEINLRPTNKSDDFPVLWLGVLNDAMMPMLDIEWEILRAINSEKIAFTAMVRFDRKETAAVDSK